MKTLPRALLTIALTWSSACPAIHASGTGGGIVLNSASFTIYQGQVGGLLSGSNNALYTSTYAGMANSVTLTRTGSNSTWLDPLYVGNDPILVSSPSLALIAGSTLSLTTGSTVIFNGTVTSSGNPIYNTGGTLVTNATNTVNSGVIVNAASNSYLTSTGVVTVGAGSLILSNNTSFSGGANTTVTGGSLLFGTGGSVTAGVLLNSGNTSILSPSSNLTTTGISGATLNLSGATLTLGNPNNATLSGTINQSVGTIRIGAGTFSLSPTSNISLTSLPPIQNTAPGSLGTTVKFLDAALTSKGASLLFLPAMQSLASDPVSVHINDFTAPSAGDKIVLQLTFDPTAAASLGDLTKLYLAWFDPADGQWKNAIEGNTDGGASSTPVAGAYNSATDFNLGTFGVDTANSTVWAVIDHDGTFGVSNSGLGTSGSSNMSATSSSLSGPVNVPEPSAAGLLLVGVGMLSRRLRRRCNLAP